LELLDFFERRQLPAAVATSSDGDYARFSLERAGLAGRFQVVVTSDEVARAKPAPDLYIEAARRLGIAPARCVALEDSAAGVLAARAAGMTAVLVPDMTPPSIAAIQAASHVLRSLDEARLLIEAMVAGAASA
jgi:beta-phosphoglucomutase-like phosphatase (HAD superfamily)